MRIHYLPGHQIPLAKRRRISSNLRLRVFVRSQVVMYSFLYPPSESHVLSSSSCHSPECFGMYQMNSPRILLQLIAEIKAQIVFYSTVISSLTDPQLPFG